MSGKVTAISAGTAEIRVTVTLSGVIKSAAVKLVVKDDPDAIKLDFKALHANVGDTAKVEVLNAERAKGITFTTSDEKIAVVDGNGNVTGINIGRVTITATADFGGGEIKTSSIEIPVVGENILDSRGVDHGTFDGGRFSLQTDGVDDFTADNKDQFWAVPATSAYAEKVSIVSGKSYVSELSNVLKVSREKAGIDNQIIVATGRHVNTGGQGGGFVLDNSKIYEFTGWVNTKNVNNAPSLYSTIYRYYNNTDEVYGALSSAHRVAPEGDGEWQSISTIPFDISDVETELMAQPRINSGKASWTGDFYFADFSFHEVEFDKVDFTSKTSMANLHIGDSVLTTALPLSTTGKEIKSFDAAGKQKSIKVSYTSSDESVATIASDGTITVRGDGTATVTASITLGKVTRTATLPVCVASGVAIEKAELYVNNATLVIGETAQSTVKLINNDGSYADTTGTVISYTSDAPSIAEVDSESGTISAVTKGTATVTATVSIGGAVLSANLKVKVVGDNLRSVQVSAEKLFQPGDKGKAEVAIYSASGKILPYDECSVKYETSDKNIVSVENDGTLEAHTGGIATITAYVLKDGITVRGKTRLVVNYIKDVNLTVEESSLEPGEKSNVSVSLAMYDGQEIDSDDCTLSYQSLNDSVAYVGDDGKILAVGDGECYITAYATYEDVVAESNPVKVSVYDGADLVSAELYGPSSITDKSVGQLSIKGWLQSGQEVDIPFESVTFEIVESTPQNAVTIDANGVVHGVAVGYATIQAKVNYRGAQDLLSNTVTVNVTEGIAKEIMIDFRSSYTPATATIAANGWTINYELSRNNIAGSLERHEFYGIRAALTNAWLTSPGATTNRFAFDFNVPADGIYTVEFLGAKSSKAGINVMFLDNKYLGTYDHRHENFYEQEGEVKTLNTVELKSGKHTFLVAVQDNTGSSKGAITQPYITYVKLTPVDKMPVPVEVRVGEENITLAAGEIAEIDAALIMSNGAEYGFGADYKATEAYTDGLLFAVDSNEIISVDAATGKIRALAAGDAKVTVTAKLGNDSFTKEVSVTVTDEILSVVTAKVKNKTVFVDEAVDVEVEAILEPGRRVADNSGVEISYVSMTPNTVTVEDGVITAIAAGYGQIKVIVKLGKITKEHLVSFEVFPSDFDKLSLSLSAGRYYVLKNIGSIKLIPHALTNLGKELDLSDAEITFTSSNPEIAPINDAGEITLRELGKVTFTAEVTKNGIKRTESFEIEIVDGKSEPTYHTMQMRENTLRNIGKYDWAKNLRDKALEKADKYVDKAMQIRDMIEPEGLPRTSIMRYKDDPEVRFCAYCKTDCRAEYGLYPWVVDPINRPWKIQCPECKRLFPSNDFESYYELGLDEYGKFDAERARNENQRLIDSGFFANQSADRQKNGYLANDLYPEKGEGWGVDDGWGFYPPGETFGNDQPRRIAFIAYYLHDGFWVSAGSYNGFIEDVLPALQNAYLYTGDKKYGKAGLLILDRIADLYADFNWNKDNEDFRLSQGGTGYGKISERTREPILVDIFTEAYDAFYPLMEDEEIISILSAEAEKYGLENPKTNAWLIRQNIEDNILREAYDAIKENSIGGNYGKYQATLSQIAIIIDHYPESKEMIDWILQPGEPLNQTPRVITGGNLLNHLMYTIDRDGHPEESPGYNVGQVGRILPVADNIARYDDYPVADVYKNPKFFSMFDANIRISKGRGYAQMGDGHYTACIDELVSASLAASYFMSTGIVELAQY
ncbi:MAG: Ig-like domain-containing protein, partial [Oscillospiraceae bacterium]|nr:Ig-like domain-containing protein [Oscillospiraceae bacterium]